MSLITDALQKAQSPHASPTMRVPSAPHQSTRWGLAMLLIVLGGTALAFWPHHAGHAPTAIAPTPAPGAARATRPGTMPQPIMNMFPVGPTASALSWKVDGVIVGMGKPTAVINGQVVEEGQQVRGAKVVSVNTDRVQLLENGETIDLPLDSNR